jgi:hypothetical protein
VLGADFVEPSKTIPVQIVFPVRKALRWEESALHSVIFPLWEQEFLTSLVGYEVEGVFFLRCIETIFNGGA